MFISATPSAPRPVAAPWTLLIPRRCPPFPFPHFRFRFSAPISPRTLLNSAQEPFAKS
jgi:hypothetical protein